MTRANMQMTLALIGSLAFSAVAVALTRRDIKPRPRLQTRGAQLLVDSTGTAAARKHYRRIASGSILADRLLLELCEPERIVGLSQHGLEASAVAHRYGSHARIELTGDLEALIALGPDLILVNNLTDQRRVERLREAGVVVFELGPMRGMSTLLEDISTVAALLGEEARGQALSHMTAARMHAVAADVPRAGRKTAIYVGMHGTQFYGGTRGTSYHDVLLYAGLVDAAATRYEDWPAYSAEELLALDPEVIVTVTGQRSALCDHAVLRALRACNPPGKVVEVDQHLLVDPSLAMVDASMIVREAVYGAVPGPLP